MPLNRDERTALSFLGMHCATGVAAAAILTAVMIYYDMFGLWSLMRADGNGILAGAMLFFGLAITFGSIAMGTGVMMLAKEKDSDPIEPRNDD